MHLACMMPKHGNQEVLLELPGIWEVESTWSSWNIIEGADSNHSLRYWDLNFLTPLVFLAYSRIANLKVSMPDWTFKFEKVGNFQNLLKHSRVSAFQSPSLWGCKLERTSICWSINGTATSTSKSILKFSAFPWISEFEQWSESNALGRWIRTNCASSYKLN
jgi:hypothetical protein